MAQKAIALEDISKRGYAIVAARLSDDDLKELLSSLEAAQDSSHARKRGEETYAIRNILRSVPGIYELAMREEIFDLIKAVLGQDARPVKAILFDKTPGVNDVLYMRPLLLHSSRPSTNPTHRRVLHIEYAGADLPGGLEWGQ